MKVDNIYGLQIVPEGETRESTFAGCEDNKFVQISA